MSDALWQTVSGLVLMLAVLCSFYAGWSTMRWAILFYREHAIESDRSNRDG